MSLQRNEDRERETPDPSEPPLDRPDEEIAADVRAELTWDERLDVAGVEVQVQRGTVTLRGHVPTHLARRAALERAANASGVREILDRMVVRLPTGGPPSDEEIRREVEDALQRHPHLAHSDIRAEVRQGAVTLRGTVSGYWKRGVAEDVAGSVGGVTAVHPELAVVPHRGREDDEIARSLLDALGRRSEGSPREIAVEVREGRVILSGAVPTWSARRAAQEIAAHTRGVRELEDRLVVDG